MVTLDEAGWKIHGNSTVLIKFLNLKLSPKECIEKLYVDKNKENNHMW